MPYCMALYTPITSTPTEMKSSSTFNWKFWLQWVLATTLGWLIGSSILPLEYIAGLCMGLAQWLVLRPMFPKTSWWIPLSTGGWMLGWGISSALVNPQAAFLIAGLVGLITSSFQWYILRQWVPMAGWWVIVNPLAWVIALSDFTDPRLAGLVVGIITGLSLELLIRYKK